MHSFTVIHESRKLKQARFHGISMLTCCTVSVPATPSWDLVYSIIPQPECQQPAAVSECLNIDTSTTSYAEDF